jgi:pumilio RNA-binding family
MIKDIIRIQSYLSRRQYANFIIQQILLKGQAAHKDILLNDFIYDDFVSMAMDKYGSNIAEKSIVYGTNEFRYRIWTDKISITERYLSYLTIQ